jgi:DNA-directed RNA polymerase specialized sigma24 family protein
MRSARSQDWGDPADEALLAGIALGDEWATLVFVRRYQRCLFGLARTVLGREDLAETVAGEAFLWIFRHAAVHDVRHAPVPTWARAVTRRLAIDVRGSRAVDPAVLDDPWFVAVTSGGDGPEARVAPERAPAGVRAGLGDLPVDQRRAVVLARLCGWTDEDIARAELTPRAVVEDWVRTGLATLEERFGADSLLVLAPEIEPPIGFEVRLAERRRAEAAGGHSTPVPRIVWPGGTRIGRPHRGRIGARRSGR